MSYPAGAATPPRDAPTDWATWGFGPARTGYNPFEQDLTTATIGQLRVRWNFDLHAAIDTQPIVAAGAGPAGANLVYVGSEHGTFAAVDAATGREVWDRGLGDRATNCLQTPDKRFGITGSAALNRGTNGVYVAGGDGTLYGLDMATGRNLSGWPVRFTADPKHEHVWGGLAISRGAVYVPIGGMCDTPPYRGRIVKISLRTHRVVGNFFTVPPKRSGGSIWGWGGVSVDEGAGRIFAATGNALFVPQSGAFAEHIVKLNMNLRVTESNYPGLRGRDVDFGSTPMLYQAPGCPAQLTAENKTGELFVYNRNNIRSGPVQRIAVTGSHEFIGVTAYNPVTRMVYVTNPKDGRFVHGLVAFRVDSSCRLTPAWQQRAGVNGSIASTPTVAGGIVYYGDGLGRKVRAFNAATGAPLGDSGNSINGAVFAAPTVANGWMFAASRDHRLYGFATG